MYSIYLQAREGFLNIASRIGQLQRDCGVPIPVDDYVEQFHFGLMEVVFEWARGMVRVVLINVKNRSGQVKVKVGRSSS